MVAIAPPLSPGEESETPSEVAEPSGIGGFPPSVAAPTPGALCSESGRGEVVSLERRVWSEPIHADAAASD